MKIDPSGKYDQQVYITLRKIRHKQRQNKSNRIVYLIQLYPDPQSSIDQQLIIDNLEKEKVIRRVLTYEGSVGKNKNYVALNIELEILEPAFSKLYSQYKRAFESAGKDKLLIYRNGKVIFYCKGKEYKAVFRPNTNSYEFLVLLATNRPKVLSFEEINRALKRKKEHSYAKAPDRVRETVKYIRKKLGYKGKRLFRVDYGFGLIPEFEIKAKGS